MAKNESTELNTSPPFTANFNSSPKQISTSYDILHIKSPKTQRFKGVGFNDAIRSAHRISRIFGQLPFSVKYKSNDEIDGTHVGIFDLIWFCISIAIYLYFFRTIWMTFDLSGDFQSLIIFLISRLILLADLLLSAIAIILDMLNRNRLVGILKELKVFDVEVIYLASKFLNY